MMLERNQNGTMTFFITLICVKGSVGRKDLLSFSFEWGEIRDELMPLISFWQPSHIRYRIRRTTVSFLCDTFSKTHFLAHRIGIIFFAVQLEISF